MASRPPQPASAKGILGFIPEIVKLSQNRFRAQIRLLGLAALVGVVAGLGAIAFYVATRVAEHYALGMSPATTRSRVPAVKPRCPGSRAGASIFSVAPAVGPDDRRAHQRRARLHLCPRGRRTWHGFGDCRLSLSPGANPPRVSRWSRSSPVRLPSARADRAAERGRSPRSGPVSAPCWATCCGCGPPSAACSWPRAWGPESARFSAPRWPERSSPRKCSTVPRSSSPRSSFRRGSPASFPIASTACIPAGSRCSPSPDLTFTNPLQLGPYSALGTVHGPAGSALHAHLLWLQGTV